MNSRSRTPSAVFATLAALAMACSLSPAAYAQSKDGGAYAGISLGSTSYPDTLNGVDTGGAKTAGKLFAGYQFTPNFALEAGSVQLGQADKVSANSAYLDAVGILPLDNKWSLTGRLGVAQTSVSTVVGNDSGNGLKVGLGADYSLTQSLSLRGEWERYQVKAFGDNPSADMYSLGLKFSF